MRYEIEVEVKLVADVEKSKEELDTGTKSVMFPGARFRFDPDRVADTSIGIDWPGCRSVVIACY